MSDTAKPKNGQTVLLPVPNGLIRGDLKPDVFVCWIFLTWDMGSLDYADRSWESLQWLFSIGRDTELGRKQVQRIIKSLEDSGWLSTEKIRDGVRIYLFPSNDAPEEHLGAIKDRVNYFRMYRQTAKKRYNAMPYRVKHMTENGNFTRIPILAVEDPRFTRTDKGVYAVIRSYVNAQYGRSIETMAKEINVTKSPAEKSLKRWKEAGYIVYDGRRRVVNQYEFNDSPELPSVQTGHEERIRGHQERISSTQMDMTNAIETRNNKTSNEPSNLRSEATGYQDSEIPGETEGNPSGPERSDGISPSSLSGISNSSASSAVMHGIPAQRGTEELPELDRLRQERQEKEQAAYHQELQERLNRYANPTPVAKKNSMNYALAAQQLAGSQNAAYEDEMDQVREDAMR
jgi:predicted transcriptional regulator